MNKVPVVQTERLLLRGWKDCDLNPLARMMANPEVARFIGGVQPRSSVWRTVAMYAGLWSLYGFGFWVVERRSDGVFLGRVGFWKPESWPGVELAWSLDLPYWRNGYATEAARAAKSSLTVAPMRLWDCLARYMRRSASANSPSASEPCSG